MSVIENRAFPTVPQRKSKHEHRRFEIGDTDVYYRLMSGIENKVLPTVPQRKSKHEHMRFEIEILRSLRTNIAHTNNGSCDRFHASDESPTESVTVRHRFVTGLSASYSDVYATTKGARRRKLRSWPEEARTNRGSRRKAGRYRNEGSYERVRGASVCLQRRPGLDDK